MDYKSITVDFEHKRVIYRPTEGPERVVSVNTEYPALFQAEYSSAELPEKSVEAALKKQESAGIPAELVRGGKNIEVVRSNLKTVIAKEKAHAEAVKRVDAELLKFNV